jgi:hypothetical protein
MPMRSLVYEITAENAAGRPAEPDHWCPDLLEDRDERVFRVAP